MPGSVLAFIFKTIGQALAVWPCADTIPLELRCLLAMASLPQTADLTNRLVVQLQVLSEVAENLTYRLLDLEDRLTAHEQRLLEQAESANPQQAEEVDLRLLETEERLARMEELLATVGDSSAGRQQLPLRLAGPSLRLSDVATPQDDPFPDEGEQPFMDELTA